MIFSFAEDDVSIFGKNSFFLLILLSLKGIQHYHINNETFLDFLI